MCSHCTQAGDGCEHLQLVCQCGIASACNFVIVLKVLLKVLCVSMQHLHPGWRQQQAPVGCDARSSPTRRMALRNHARSSWTSLTRCHLGAACVCPILGSFSHQHRRTRSIHLWSWSLTAHSGQSHCELTQPAVEYPAPVGKAHLLYGFLLLSAFTV